MKLFANSKLEHFNFALYPPKEWGATEINQGFCLTDFYPPKPGIYEAKNGFTLLIRSWAKDEDRDGNPPKQRFGAGTWWGAVELTAFAHGARFDKWEAWVWLPECK